MGSTADIFGTAFPQKHSQIHTTLLDLVQVVNQVTADEDDRLVAATVAHMVNSGQVQLTGTFKGKRVVIR